MTLPSKFKKDISTLRDAVNKEIYLDVKNPKLYKKITRYYVSEGLVQLSGEDPDADYNSILECVAEDLELVEVLWVKNLIELLMHLKGLQIL